MAQQQEHGFIVRGAWTQYQFYYLLAARDLSEPQCTQMQNGESSFSGLSEFNWLMCVNVLSLEPGTKQVLKKNHFPFYCTASLVPLFFTRQNQQRCHPKSPDSLGYLCTPKVSPDQECEGLGRSAEAWGDCAHSWRLGSAIRGVWPAADTPVPHLRGVWPPT